MYEYGIVREHAGTNSWEFWSASGKDGPLPFFDLMNALGKKGWEAVAVGNVGGSPAPEILMKKAHRA